MGLLRQEKQVGTEASIREITHTESGIRTYHSLEQITVARQCWTLTSFP